VRLPAPFRREGDHIAIDLRGAHVLFTTRRGGVSGGPFSTLNLGLFTDDDPAHVRENRVRAAGTAGVSPERLAHGFQVHGAVVRTVTEPPAVDEPPPEADGQATRLAEVAPMVLVADCLPIAVAAEGGAAMLHAGWRGLAAGVVRNGMDALAGLGVEAPFEAAIGPGAGGCCYEVGREVRDAFAGVPGAARETDDRTFADLKAVARSRLHDAGVHTVHDVGLCTICSEPGLFFSHRRDGGITGRQAGIARLA
jgi:YfiH family protein